MSAEILQTPTIWESDEQSGYAIDSENAQNAEYFRGIRTDPFFYTIRKIPWHIFLTFHYRKPSHYADSQSGLGNRRKQLFELFYKARKDLRLPQRSIQFFGTSERGTSDRIHTHTLVHLPHGFKASENDWIEALAKNVQRDLVDVPKQGCGILPMNIEMVRDSEAAAAYVTKVSRVRGDSCLEHHRGQSFIAFAAKFARENGDRSTK